LFLRFIEEQGYSNELVWVFREDVTNCRREYWVRAPVPKINPQLVQHLYEFGRRQELGVTLEVLCRVEGRSACFVWVPKDKLDAEYAMQGPLKFKVPMNPVDASMVRSSFLWRWRCWLNKWRLCATLSELLPSREEVVRRTANSPI
jgi:hypothetical protein